MRRRHTGNFIAEWYGFRVWPTVDASSAAAEYQTQMNCPFLSLATEIVTPCAKQGRTGVCTISSDSNGTRQDWLACPYRVLDPTFTLLEDAVRTLYGVTPGQAVVLRPLTALQVPEVSQEVINGLVAGDRRVFVFSQLGLGGEVKIPQTAGSPQVEVDSSIVELVLDNNGNIELGRHLFFEIQTMDFHGSPLHATALMANARDANPETFHTLIAAHPEWAGARVEGPNKANVFKRTVYQTILEIQLARTPNCAGFVIALPEPVWDSWRIHLGLPQLHQDGDIWRLNHPTAEHTSLVEPDQAWIFVFDIDRGSAISPNPLKVVRKIVTTSAALIHYTFEEAPRYAVEHAATERFRASLAARLQKSWPEFATLRLRDDT